MNDQDLAQWNEDGTMAAPEKPLLDISGILRRRKWLIVFGLIVGLGLGYLYFSRQPPVFESQARILVEKKAPPMPLEGVDDPGFYKSGGIDQALVLKSNLILERAVNEKRLGSLPSLRGAKPVSAISGGLQVSAAGQQSGVLDVSFQGPDPEDCAEVVNGVIDTYMDFLGDSYQNVGQETVSLISKAKDELLTQLDAKTSEYRDFRQDAALLWKEGESEGTNIHQARLSQIEGTRSQLMLSRAQVKARLDAIEQARAHGGNREALLLMVGNSSDSPAKAAENPLEKAMFPLLMEEQLLLDRYGPDHPKVQTVRKKIQLTREFHLGQTSEGEPAKDFLEVYVQSLREELKTIDQQVEELNTLFTDQQEAAKTLTVDQVKDSTYREEISRTKQLFDAVVKRLEEISLVKDYGGYNIQILSAAGPGRQVAPNLARIMIIAGLLGLVGGCMLAYVVDLADKRFHTPMDITRELNAPLVGHIPVIPEKRTDLQPQLDAILVAAHRPQSQLAESYREVRTALYFTSRQEGLKVIQVTSPVPGDGKTTLAANLAISIAQSGKRILLLDADFRRPRMHKLFNVHRDVGLASVIAGESEPLEAVQATSVNHLSVMACGPKPNNPSELLTSPEFKELLDVLREQFDFVVIDTPPLLAVTDPSAVAARADAVLMTLRIRKNVRLSATRAMEMLAALDAHVLGIVVNGVAPNGQYGYGYSYNRYGGYRYGGYHSGYGQGYGYGYSEYYSEDDQAAGEGNGATAQPSRNAPRRARQR